MTEPQHPMQPIYVADDGIIRFKHNAIVRFLLDKGGFDLNKLAYMEFSDEDRMQLAQLIGYSVSGYSELHYVSDESWTAASEVAEKLRADQESK